MPIEVWVTEGGVTKKYRTNILHFQSGSVLTGGDAGSTGVVPVGVDFPTPPKRLIYATFDGQPYTDLYAGHMGKILPLGITGNLSRVRMTTDVNTNCVVSIWKDVLANGDPTIADDIIDAGTPLALSAARFYEDATLTGWTKPVAATDVWLLKIVSIDIGCKFLQVELEITPT